MLYYIEYIAKERGVKDPASFVKEYDIIDSRTPDIGKRISEYWKARGYDVLRITQLKEYKEDV